MSNTDRDSMRASVLGVVDEYGGIPEHFSGFRAVITDAVTAAYDHQERRRPDRAAGGTVVVEAVMAVYQQGHQAGFCSARDQAVTALRAAGMGAAADVVLAL